MIKIEPSMFRDTKVKLEEPDADVTSNFSVADLDLKLFTHPQVVCEKLQVISISEPLNKMALEKNCIAKSSCFSCQCGAFFAVWDSFKCHYLMLHLSIPPRHSKRRRKGSVTNGVVAGKILTDGGKKCLICGRVTSTKYELFRHYQRIHQPIFLKCTFCKKKMKREYLKRHIRDVHIGDRPFICQTCGRRFKRKSPLEIHNKRAHIGVKDVLCGTCGKGFTDKNALRAHEVTHRKYKPFSCHDCGQTFRFKSDMTKHIFRLHNNIERRHKCHLCEKEYHQKQHLEIHLLNHIGIKLHQCSLCFKKFTYKRSVRKHMSIFHLGKKKHLCSLCNKGFNDFSKFQVHRRKHMESRRYMCDFCGLGTDGFSHMGRHIRQCHLQMRDFICPICENGFQRRDAYEKHLRVCQPGTPVVVKIEYEEVSQSALLHKVI